MKNLNIIYILILFISLSFSNIVIGQESKQDISSMTKAEILKMTNDELLALSIEDLDKLAEKLGVSVEQLMELSIKSGHKGGFGKQLEDLDIKTYVHGYTAFWYRDYDFNRGKKNQTFSMHYFNPIIGANIKDKIIVEAMPEYEHAAAEISLRYAIVDYAFCKYVTLRTGKFLMPIGKFNEYLYPEHINLFADRPISHWKIIPSVWSEVGAQLRGHIEFDDNTSINYSAFIVNGLQQAGGKYGGDIRSMRDNYRDYKNDNKAYGGRFGIKPIKELEFGFSYYKGAYSEDGKMDLVVGCFDWELLIKRSTLRGEYTFAKEDTLNGSIKKHGGFMECAYRINKYFQPAVRMELCDLPNVTGLSDLNEDDKIDYNTEKIKRISLGIIFYPEPELLSRFSFKINYSIIPNDGQGKKRSEFVLQTALGF